MACRAFLIGLALAGGGCVEAFDGSNLQIDFALGVQASARPGQTPQLYQPPADTHYELYAADLVYQLDDQGEPALDANGHRIITQSYLFKVTEFAIHPAIDTASPCLIELEEAEFPGLHVTQFEKKVKEQVKARTGIDDPFDPDLPMPDSSDILNAIRRMENLADIERELKAVTSHQAFKYEGIVLRPDLAVPCPTSYAATDLPHPTCFDAVANAQRLRGCRAQWAAHPHFYEGSDKVFSLPLNGSYLGMVTGMNPLNGGPVGGSSMFVDPNLIGHNGYFLNWQYDDPDAVELTTGNLYMKGEPVDVSRGVITVPLSHPFNSAINADLAIIPNLGHDDVHF